MDIVMNDKKRHRGDLRNNVIRSKRKNSRRQRPRQSGMVVEAIQAGAKDGIIKPFRAEVLIEEVTRVAGE